MAAFAFRRSRVKPLLTAEVLIINNFTKENNRLIHHGSI